jgi:hypothetical protein
MATVVDEKDALVEVVDDGDETDDLEGVVDGAIDAVSEKEEEEDNADVFEDQVGCI